jgi:hypothetical protein
MRPSLLLLAVLFACTRPDETALSASHQRALSDTVLTLFDSLAAIHRDHPDSALLRRLHPAADTVLFIEGGQAERMTGDSLARRVLVAHVPVSRMVQRFDSWSTRLLGPDAAIATARETVNWTDTSGEHHYEGWLTLGLERVGGRWVIRGYVGMAGGQGEQGEKVSVRRHSSESWNP